MKSQNRTDVLWCCHVRGPDEVHAAPNYETALSWSDQLLEVDRGIDHSDPFTPYLSAVPAPWPHSTAAHAEDLPKSVMAFTSPPAPKQHIHASDPPLH